MSDNLSMNQVLIEKLTKILEVNLDKEHFGVKELANEAGLSRSKLHRKLQSLKGKSASRFIREFRLEKAMVMLQNNEATASEISYRVGFSSPTYFNTCFHDYYGYPPGEAKIRNPKVDEQNEAEQRLELISADQTISKKALVKKTILGIRMVWINTFFILLLSVVSYNLYQNYQDSNSVEIPIIDSNDKSIAIIPFKNLSENLENQHFVDGVTGSIQNHLNMISDLKVVPNTSMKKYRDLTMTTSEIGKEVGVSYLLDGSVQKHGDSIRIIAHLIDANQNSQLSSFVFDWEYKNIFAIQSKIAIQIAKELDVEVAPYELQSIEKIPTKNLEAYNLWLLGNFQLTKSSKSGNDNAITLYKKAITLDSSFVEVYVNHAALWLGSGTIWGLYNERQAWENGKKLLQKAYEIDNDNLQVNKYLHIGYFLYDWNFELVEKFYQEILNLDIDSKTYLLDYALKTGRYKFALSGINYLIQEDPTVGFLYGIKAQALFFLNRKEEALNILRSNDALFNDNMNYLREASKYYFYLGEYENSKVLLDKIFTNFPDRPPVILWLNAVHHDMDGDKETAQELLNALLKKYEEEASGSPAWFIALYYCSKDDYENAFLWLEKSYERHEVEMTWLREEPVLMPLRNDKRYKKLYKKVGFPMKPHSF